MVCYNICGEIMEYILSVGCVIIFFYSVFIIVKNIFYKSRLKRNYTTVASKKSDDLSKNDTLKIFLYAFLFRVIIILISIFIYQIFINDNNDFNFKNIIDNWIKWDAHHYIRIANGYSSYIENNLYPTLVFFPLYPWLMKFINIFVQNFAISGLLVSILSYSFSCVFIYKLVSLDYEKNTACKTIILISISPFAFFFGSIMSESVFLLFSTITLYYIRKHNWLLVGIFGMLSALSRLIGVFLIVPALVEIIEEYHILKNIQDYKYIFKIIKEKVIPILFIPLGILIYLYINYSITNDWFYFLKMQNQIWNQNYTSFFKIPILLINFIKNQGSLFAYTIFIPELITVVVMYYLLVRCVKKNRTMYTSWFLIYILINTSMSWPLSIGRYFTCALPAFIFMAKSCEHNNKKFIFLVIIFSILFAIFLMAYLTNKYVM